MQAIYLMYKKNFRKKRTPIFLMADCISSVMLYYAHLKGKDSMSVKIV